MTTTPTSATNANRRRSTSVVLLVPVPGRSAIHDLWAGTKLLVVFGVSVLLTFYPDGRRSRWWRHWLAAAVWIAGIPRGALPPIPRWLWALLALGFVTAALAGGQSHGPDGRGGHRARWGIAIPQDHRAVDRAAGPRSDGVVDHERCRNRACSSDVGSSAEGVSHSGGRMGGGPALALRAFPMLIDEFQVLYAARLLWPRSNTLRSQGTVPAAEPGAISFFTMAAAVVVTLRRADEMVTPSSNTTVE